MRAYDIGVVATLLIGSSSAQTRKAIPSWRLQSTEIAGNDLANLSQPSYNSSSWYAISARKSVFAGLVEAGVYDTEQLFFSKNLQETVDYLPFYSPWLYRSALPLQPQTGRHYFLQTNGITSKADIWLNGHEVADKTVQTGCYGGHTYDITDRVNPGDDGNAILIRAFPTDYNKDFAMGFVDWNPYPPDNGTGVWRDVFIKETGPLMMGPVRVVHDYVPGNGKKDVEVTLKVDVTNLENESVAGSISAVIGEANGGNGACATDSDGNTPGTTFTLGARETRTVRISAIIADAKIWWPAQWGTQPLYTAAVSVSAFNTPSDVAPPLTFGIRHITRTLNRHNDTLFTLNGHPFQVRGAGYSADIFLRWDSAKFRGQLRYVLDMGLNTIRLEGKQEHPELYAIADEMGVMVLAGWECCDKWEAWGYNEDVSAPLWDAGDYSTANASMRHEAAMMQGHACVLAFLVGSDYWPNDRATGIYVDALDDLDWQNPVICSAAKRGFPELLGPSGLKMDGPYDWVPPNYWYDPENRLGSAYGFGSELGAGVGTPEMGSLKKFLSASDMEDLWTKPKKGLYHMSTNASQFYHRTIYNNALYARYGEPNSLEDYLLKSQIMDYEATRAEFEAYAAKWNAPRPATGLIYWMLNNAWPSLHWNLFDYYLHPAGSYFGTKVAGRMEHVAYDYETAEIWLINRSLEQSAARSVAVELIDLEGKTLGNKSMDVETEPNVSKSVGSVPGVSKIKDVAFLRLILSGEDGEVLSRNVYWLATTLDVVKWGHSTWYHTPVKPYADMTALQNMATAQVSTTLNMDVDTWMSVTLENESDVPAFFIRLNLVDGEGEDVVPVMWSDNYVTLFPRERLELVVEWPARSRKDVAVQVSGSNIGDMRTLRPA